MSGRKRSSGGSRRSFAWAVFAAAILAAASFGGYKALTDPRFALGDVLVSGERRTPPEAIELAAAFPRGENVWLLDTAGARRRIEALPWIATAQVRRSWPDGVRIVVAERVPVARVLLPAGAGAEEPADSIALVDADMRVLAVEPASGAFVGSAFDRMLPLLRIEPVPSLAPGTSAPDGVRSAYDAMVQLRALGLRVSEVQLRPATGVTVVCDGGLRVILGSEEELAAKVALLRAISARIVQPEDVVYVDLRSVRAPTVLYR